jgi:hypothetical protein
VNRFAANRTSSIDPDEAATAVILIALRNAVTITGLPDQGGLLVFVVFAFERFFAAMMSPAKGQAAIQPDPTRSLSKLIFDRGFDRMSSMPKS